MLQGRPTLDFKVPFTPSRPAINVPSSVPEQ